MPDADTRQLERQAAADGVRSAALLRARMRAGERHLWLECGAKHCKPSNNPKAPSGIVRWDGLSMVQGVDGWPTAAGSKCCDGTGRALFRAGVELAAYCGCVEARAVLDWPSDVAEMCPCGSFAHTVEGHDMEMGRIGPLWLNGLSRWPGALLRAAIAAAREALPVWERSDDVFAEAELRNVDPRPRRALKAAEAYAADPTEERREAWEVACNAIPTLGFVWVPDPIMVVETGRKSAAQVRVMIGAAASLLCQHSPDCINPPPACNKCDARVRAAICEALIPWALGETR